MTVMFSSFSFILCSNLTVTAAYSVIVSQWIRYVRATGIYATKQAAIDKLLTHEYYKPLLIKAQEK